MQSQSYPQNLWKEPVDIHYQAHERLIKLRQGEIYVQVFLTITLAYPEKNFW